MFSAVQIAEYFLSKDPDRKIFNKNLITKNNRKFYEGNARINKYLHLTQNIYIAKTGKKLFEDDLYAYDNGAVASDVQENYSILVERNSISTLPDDIKKYLDKIFVVLKNAELDELIELSHEDAEWQSKHSYYSKEEQKMDSLSRADELKNQYKDIIKVMDRMTI